MDAIIIAAGKSSRYHKENLLKTVGNNPVFRCTLDTAVRMQRKNMIGRIIFVAQNNHIEEIIQKEYPSVELIMNYQPDLSSSHSVRLAMAHLHDKRRGAGAVTDAAPILPSEGCVFLLADQAYLRPDSLEHLIDTWRIGKTVSMFDVLGTDGPPTDNANKRYHIAACATASKIGLPIIVDALYYPELYRIFGENGLKRFLKSHLDDTVLMPVLDMEISGTNAGGR